jgi:arsenate reductase
VTSGQAPATDPIRVIFVCTGNSARSQMAEAILRREGGDAFEVVSAGVDPRGVHPLTVRVLAEAGIDISGARSKSVNDYLGQPFDYVVTVCDRARESCPYFPGGRETLHWGFDDPAEAEGSEAERLAVFNRVLSEISRRIRTFVPLAVNARASGGGDLSAEDPVEASHG